MTIIFLNNSSNFTFVKLLYFRLYESVWFSSFINHIVSLILRRKIFCSQIMFLFHLEKLNSTKLNWKKFPTCRTFNWCFCIFCFRFFLIFSAKRKKKLFTLMTMREKGKVSHWDLWKLSTQTWDGAKKGLQFHKEVLIQNFICTNSKGKENYFYINHKI